MWCVLYTHKCYRSYLYTHIHPPCVHGSVGFVDIRGKRGIGNNTNAILILTWELVFTAYFTLPGQTHSDLFLDRTQKSPLLLKSGSANSPRCSHSTTHCRGTALTTWHNGSFPVPMCHRSRSSTGTETESRCASLYSQCLA